MTADWPYRVVLVFVALIQVIVFWRYMKRSGAVGTIFRKRAEGLPLSIALGVFLFGYSVAFMVYLINPNWMAWSAVPLPPAARWFGTIVMASGAVFADWGMQHLDTNLTISISTRDGHTLVTTGPYRWVRHPLYTGGMVESIGACLVVANGAVACLALAFWALIAWRTPMEEARLIDTFGDTYRAYQVRVGRLLPRIPPRSNQT